MSQPRQDDYQARLRRALCDDPTPKAPPYRSRQHLASKVPSSRPPVRPKTAQSTLSSALALSPRQAAVTAGSSRCKSAAPIGSYFTPGHRHATSAPPSSRVPVESSNGVSFPYNSSDSSAPQTAYAKPQLEINVKSREHLEIKSCLLSYMHRINVNELQQTNHRARLEIDRSKVQQLISHGGVLDDGTVLDAVRRKTVFLLQHFFSMDRAPEDTEGKLLYEVVDEWACKSKSTPEAVAAVWRSITRHIEQSYFLRRALVAQADPDRVSIMIAMDCLKKLSAHLPDYQRVLDVSLIIVESGLCLPATNDEHGSRCMADVLSSKRFYFEEVQSLLSKERQAMATIHQASKKQSDQREENSRPLCERVIHLLDQMREEDALEREKLFLRLLRSNMELLSSLACGETLKYFIGHPSPAKRDFFYSLLMHLLDSDATARLFSELLQSREADLKTFLHENFPVMDKVLVDCDAVAKTSLFHRLIDRHPTDFAAVLWQSPYLTAHIFQGSQHLVSRILEQNTSLLSRTLAQRTDILLGLMNQALRDNTAVAEEFIVSHPRALSDLMVNRAPAIAEIVKAKQFILTGLLQACQATLGESLASSPDILLHALKTTPDLMSFIIRSDDSILSTIFKLAPQCLSDALEKHPAIFADIAHRKPILVTRLFTEHPDLLLEPLEANPILLTTFLAVHRNHLPDFSDPNFETMMHHANTKKLIDVCVQTDRVRLGSNAGKALGRTNLLDDRSSLVHSVNTLERSMRAPAVPTRPIRADGVAEPDAIPTPDEAVTEIIRLYVAKIDADNRDDVMGRKRQRLSDFILDVYLGELGFMAAARQKLARLVLAARRSGGIQESVRIKWFVRFLNATRDERPMPATALDFYLAILQQLFPADRLVSCLVDEPYHTCVISHTTMRALIAHGLVSRLLENKDQKRRLLLLQTSMESDSFYFAETSGADPPPKAKVKSMEVLHVDDVLDAVMSVWARYQQRVNDDWTAAFQRMVPNGGGVVHVNVVKAVVRRKMPALDDRAILKVYHSCGQENELGEHALQADEFALAMTVLQEQHALRKLAPPPPATTQAAATILGRS